MTGLWQIVSWTAKGVKALKSHVDGNQEELFEKTRDAEGCPHVDMIVGFTQPYNDMLAHVGEHGGVAWKNGDGNAQWYWHPQESFLPLSYTESVKGKRMTKIDKAAGKNCAQCVAAVRKRAG